MANVLPTTRASLPAYGYAKGRITGMEAGYVPKSGVGKYGRVTIIYKTAIKPYKAFLICNAYGVIGWRRGTIGTTLAAASIAEAPVTVSRTESADDGSIVAPGGVKGARTTAAGLEYITGDPETPTILVSGSRGSLFASNRSYTNYAVGLRMMSLDETIPSPLGPSIDALPQAVCAGTSCLLLPNILFTNTGFPNFSDYLYRVVWLDSESVLRYYALPSDAVGPLVTAAKSMPVVCVPRGSFSAGANSGTTSTSASVELHFLADTVKVVPLVTFAGTKNTSTIASPSEGINALGAVLAPSLDSSPDRVFVRVRKFIAENRTTFFAVSYSPAQFEEYRAYKEAAEAAFRPYLSFTDYAAQQNFKQETMYNTENGVTRIAADNVVANVRTTDSGMSWSVNELWMYEVQEGVVTSSRMLARWGGAVLFQGDRINEAYKAAHPNTAVIPELIAGGDFPNRAIGFTAKSTTFVSTYAQEPFTPPAATSAEIRCAILHSTDGKLIYKTANISAVQGINSINFASHGELDQGDGVYFFADENVITSASAYNGAIYTHSMATLTQGDTPRALPRLPDIVLPVDPGNLLPYAPVALNPYLA